MKDLLEVFADKVLIGDGCWEWIGSKTGKGYGQVNRGGKLKKAHRLFYEWMIGPIPENLEPGHTCRNRACVRPAHMELVTHQENVLRGDAPAAINARKTHCKRGHELVPENLLKKPNGHRGCKECKRQWSVKNNWKYR